MLVEVHAELIWSPRIVHWTFCRSGPPYMLVMALKVSTCDMGRSPGECRRQFMS